MADNNSYKQTPRRRGPGGGMAPAEKAKNFKGSISKLMQYIGRYKIAILAVMIMAAASTVFTVIGPKVLGKATTGLSEGLMKKITGTGGIDFSYIGRILIIVLCLYACSAIFSFIQGWIMTGVSQKVCYRLRKEISEKINRMPIRGAFFAMNAQNASLLRPYLPPELPVFGTSYSNPMHQKDSMLAKTQSNDLNGMITLEIPAEENTSTLVAQYKGERENLSLEELQMFSVGVDAWTLGTKWIDWARRIEVPDGLTGRLSFDKDSGSKVKRELVKTVVSPNKTGKASEEDLVQFTESAEEAGL